MSEMIERVAKRLCQIEHGATAWDESFDRRDRCCVLARAAIEALREPTPAMVNLGMMERVNDAGTHEVWRAMIDEALR